MRDIKYIIKRIIIGVGIALAIMFIKQNVYAYEWETSADVPIFDENRIMVFTYGVFPNQTTSFSYPVTYSSSQNNQNFAVGSHAGALPSSASIVERQTPMPMTIQNFQVYLFGVSLSANQRYKLIIPMAYNDTIYSSLSSNVNETLILDASTYSTNNNFININSGSLAFGVENDIQDNANYPYYLYFNIQFTPTEDITNQDIIIYINGDSTTFTATVTSLNNFTFSNNIPYLLKSNKINVGSGYVGESSKWTNNFYKPFVYTTSQNADNWYIDGNDIVASGSNDIKSKIDEIINGQFTEDLEFPHIFGGGGLSFGEQEYTLQDLLIMPINFFRSLVSSDVSCQPIAIPVPGLTGNFYLPCMQTFAVSFIGQQLVDIIKLLLGCYIGFDIVFKVYNAIQRMLDPNEKLIYFDDIW